jgi:hypothetical protein
MVDLVLKADQIRSAPREVRAWLGSMLQQEWGLQAEADPGPGHVLAECSSEEAALVLAEIQSDYLACQVFFELGRGIPLESARGARLHRVLLSDILHHVRLGSVEHLAACLEEISRAFATVRSDPEARILAVDHGGACYVQEMTRQSIRSLWETLVMTRMGRAAEQLGSRMDLPSGPTMPLNQAVSAT